MNGRPRSHVTRLEEQDAQAFFRGWSLREGCRLPTPGTQDLTNGC